MDKGYLVELRHQEIKDGKFPLIFSASNPNVIYNIELYCRLERPDYRLCPGQIYVNAKEKLYFEYIGKELYLGDSPVFSMSWDAFRAGKGIRKVDESSLSGPLCHKLRNLTVKWRKESLESTGYRCALTNSLKGSIEGANNKTVKIEVHHCETSFIDLVHMAVEKAGLNIKDWDSFSTKQQVRIRMKFKVLHQAEPLGVPLHVEIHNLYHKWIKKEKLKVNRATFNEFTDLFNTYSNDYQNRKNRQNISEMVEWIEGQII